ncbi:hypothetical protein, conserved [Leishmania tarentolae]|uniref:Uncharacterized protein n=1 Tax=Leishmania tarentolae TaxID=5689 RepID=A0A640KR30_LEITA|nr:hypothetical protein, conserved [Leishmania tarentolae]
MSTIVPPPPSGSILQKQSSFSRPKANSAAATTTGAETRGTGGAPAANGGSTAPSVAPQKQTMTLQRPGAAGAPPAAPPQTGAPSAVPLAGPGGAHQRQLSASPSSLPAGNPNQNPAPPGMWGPTGQLDPGATCVSPVPGVSRAAPAPAVPPASSPSTTRQPHQSPNTVRQNGMNGNAYGSTGGGVDSKNGFETMGSCVGSMQGGFGSVVGGFGSMAPGKMADSTYGGMGGGYGSMNENMNGGGSAYGSMGGQEANFYGSMGGQNCMGSMYGMGGPSSSMGGSMMMPMGSMYGMGGPMGSMYGMGGPMGSMYGMGGASTMGIAAQWGSLANMSIGGQPSMTKRSNISSEYRGFGAEAASVDVDELCPNIGTFENAKDLRRSGKRGGNHLYSRGKHEKPVATGNSTVTTLTIRRKADVNVGSGTPGTSNDTATKSEAKEGRGESRAVPSTGAAGNGTAGKPRAKVPSNYNVHSLIFVEKTTETSVVDVKNPSSVVFEKDGKKETFEVDEALSVASSKDDIDSVLLSELRGNWFNGHNSALILCAGKGKAAAAQEVARQFLRKCVERLEMNEKDISVKFDITMTMVSLRYADQCCDLLKPDAPYKKLVMGSSPVYGPCLLDLETKVHKTADECVSSFNDGLKNAKEVKEIVTAFFVLKTIRKTGSEEDVHLSSLCIALCGETVAHKTDIREKAVSSPHRLFRYAVDGACVTVSGLWIASHDVDAREGLEVERKMREVKNQPPRSGNVKRFVDYTYKEIVRQRDKLESATGLEKKTREAQIQRMEAMVKDAKELLESPEKTKPKGYAMGS